MEAIISSECAESHLWPDGDGQLWALLRPNKLPPRDKNTAQGRGTHLESIRIGQILLGKVAVDVPWRKRAEVFYFGAFASAQIVTTRGGQLRAIL